MADTSKYHHSALQLWVRTKLKSVLCWSLFFLGTSVVLIVMYLRSYANIYRPTIEMEREVAELLSTATPQQNALFVDESQGAHDHRITAKIEDNRIRMLHSRPAIVEQPPNEHDLPYDNLLSIIENWNPDDPEIPLHFPERLQHFDWGNPAERLIAERYREMEIPFKLINVSDFDDVSRKWSDSYLRKNLPDMKGKVHVERSKDNHFMFWSGRGSLRKSFVPPTEIVSDMSYDDFLLLARDADARKLNSSSRHYYFMGGAQPNEHGRTFISRDLPMFSTQKNNFWITNVAANKGIQCRFGMRGVIAECHYDSGKNFVSMLRGAKRYILTPPWTCDKLGIIADTRHPSYRHSVIDWSDVAQAKQHHFADVNAIDTVVRTGEILYIPSFWFHYIISLEYSIQCNSRSGFPKGRKGQEDIHKCFNIVAP